MKKRTIFGMVLCIIFCFSAFNIYAQNTQEFYVKYFMACNSKNYEQAEKALESLLKEAPNNPYWLYYMASVQSMLNNKDNALDYFDSTIKNGYLDITTIIADNNFENIRETARFKETYKNLCEKLDKYKLLGNKQEIIVDIPPLLECYAIMLYLGNPNHTLITWSQL